MVWDKQKYFMMACGKYWRGWAKDGFQTWQKRGFIARKRDSQWKLNEPHLNYRTKVAEHCGEKTDGNSLKMGKVSREILMRVERGSQEDFPSTKTIRFICARVEVVVDAWFFYYLWMSIKTLQQLTRFHHNHNPGHIRFEENAAKFPRNSRILSKWDKWWDFSWPTREK